MKKYFLSIYSLSICITASHPVLGYTFVGSAGNPPRYQETGKGCIAASDELTRALSQLSAQANDYAARAADGDSAGVYIGAGLLAVACTVPVGTALGAAIAAAGVTSGVATAEVTTGAGVVAGTNGTTYWAVPQLAAWGNSILRGAPVAFGTAGFALGNLELAGAEAQPKGWAKPKGPVEKIINNSSSAYYSVFSEMLGFGALLSDGDVDWGDVVDTGNFVRAPIDVPGVPEKGVRGGADKGSPETGGVAVFNSIIRGGGDAAPIETGGPALSSGGDFGPIGGRRLIEPDLEFFFVQDESAQKFAVQVANAPVISPVGVPQDMITNELIAAAGRFKETDVERSIVMNALEALDNGDPLSPIAVAAAQLVLGETLTIVGVVRAADGGGGLGLKQDGWRLQGGGGLGLQGTGFPHDLPRDGGGNKLKGDPLFKALLALQARFADTGKGYGGEKDTSPEPLVSAPIDDIVDVTVASSDPRTVWANPAYQSLAVQGILRVSRTLMAKAEAQYDVLRFADGSGGPLYSAAQVGSFYAMQSLLFAMAQGICR